jgi:SAM-dependent methyltransferase
VRSAAESYFAPYLDQPPEVTRYPAGSLVLDVGCGNGMQLSRLRDAGCRGIGLELRAEQARETRRLGFPVVVGKAEQAPFRTEACQGVLCKVVLPYTEEDRVIREIGRVLALDGIAILTLHGLGYSLRYLLQPDEWRHAVYAARTILNTFVYRLFGRRLPGFLGDTVYQSPRRMLRHYRAAGLTVESRLSSRRFLGQPVFFGHVVRKRADPTAFRGA